ncbi:Glyoxylase, beta-lactamase superfamily II [Gracilibacillus ureilyticus]|uniref:Glyoxylase, beta-lactamase superfamily II n=1 Tax=Gracilibacillus ureilyticus TaxID=531814 RepID=A0A1H9M015_9BACI|nr:MBL fold metallo-hydrolase [Gracilibacillus ureilyticus]SER16785.1 Glyoxylase, beta-lactamase superfamily II [Gracilibacillus ureilyticus]
MEIEKLTLGPLHTNCYIIHNHMEAIIIDPSGDAPQIVGMIDNLGVKVKAILLTHAHFDHIGALEAVRNQFSIPVYIHLAESDWLTDPQLNGSARFGMDPLICERADHEVHDGNLKIGNFSIDVLHVPGHSPGSIAFVFPQSSMVIGGDCLFREGIGRTDLPGGSYSDIQESIRLKLFSLPDSFTVYPGHGPSTTIYHEKHNNPFITMD